jgi:hypothetical protein
LITMTGLFKALQWSWETSSRPAKWSLDRNRNRAEAQRFMKERNFTEAERHLRLAVEEADERGFSPAKRVLLRLELAEAQRRAASADPAAGGPDQAKLRAAELTVRTALEIAARASDSAGYAQALDALADVFLDMENYPALEKVAAEAVKLGAALPHPDPLGMARRVRRLGIARDKNGRPNEAIPALAKAVALHEEAYGPDHLETAKLLSELGRVYRAQGEHALAQDCLRRCLRIFETEFGADSPEAFGDLHQLAASLEESGDLAAATAQYERALAFKERKLGHQNLDDLAEMQYSLANIYVGWSNFSGARELLAECIGTFRRTGGPRLAVAYETLAQVEEISGRYDSAIRELENAGKAWERCGSERVPELIRNLEYRADLLDQLRKKREAAWLRERAAGLAESRSGGSEAAGTPTEARTARSGAGD